MMKRSVYRIIALFTAVSIGVLGSLPAAYGAKKQDSTDEFIRDNADVIERVSEQLTDGHDPFDYVSESDARNKRKLAVSFLPLMICEIRDV